MNERQRSVLLSEMPREELAAVVADLIRTNREVRQAIINLASACPNISMEI